jgi:RNA polymerase sigma-70 factor (ECF subfamily)
MLSEADLVELCVRGNRTAQREFYDRYAGRMLTVCRRYVRTTAEAEDVLQEGFLKAFEKIKSYRFESSLISWLTTIIVRTAINSKRQKLYLLPMVDVHDTMIPDVEANVVSSMEAEQLITYIQELPDGCRVIFNLYAMEGYAHQEIAEMLKISEGTSKSQYSRARQLLREKILKINSSDEYGKAAV